MLRLMETLVQTRDGLMDEHTLKSWLVRVQEDFVEKMAALQEAANGEEEDSNGEGGGDGDPEMGEGGGDDDAMMDDDDDDSSE